MPILYETLPQAILMTPNAALIGRFVRERWLTLPGLLATLAIALVAFLLYQTWYNLKNLLRPGDRPARSQEWLRLMYATISADEADISMATFARQYPVRLRARCGVLNDIQWRIYLNLQYVRSQLASTPARTIALIPASQWLFDNYNLIYREIKRLQAAGDRRALARLPVLNVGGREYPRVYLIAHKIISATNGHIQADTLIRLLCDYQRESELLARELWALPHVLGLCLLERIVDEAIRLMRNVHTRTQADESAERVAAAMRRGAGETAGILQQERFWSRSADNVFLAHFIYRLRALAVDDSEIVRWLASLHGVSAEDYGRQLHNLITLDRQHEALTESTVSALIKSLREIGELNWEENFRDISLTEAVLERDPAKVYIHMDANTRARYRGQVERLAWRCRLKESAVAEKAIQLAQLGASRSAAASDSSQSEAGPNGAGSSKPEAGRSEPGFDPLGISWDKLPVPDHVGTYLVGNGRCLLTDFVANRPLRPIPSHRRRRASRSLVYFLLIAMLTVLQLWLAWRAIGDRLGQRPRAGALLLVALGFLAVGIAILLTQSLFTRIIKPRRRLSMDFQKGIPDTARTLVVMPVILGSPAGARAYAERLERHYLANQQENLVFAILGDLRDAPQENMPEDNAILEAAAAAVQELNDQYPGPRPRFSLLVRKRLWNPAERAWMSWERKRGKLEQLNALLAGETSDSFEFHVGSPETLADIRFVITLDADTELVRDSANLLVGIMAHPLNRPVIDPNTCRIVSGYAIVQSSVTARVSDARSSSFTRVFAGESGIDSYASVLSDIYQDVFDEGIFVGKGIYDPHVMHFLLAGMIPENTVLSHDLLESSLTRCGFASNIRLLDSTPPNLAAFARRDHRWIRGDWQLLPWIFSRSPINGLSRWKMVDNLRRSLVPIASVAAILINLAFFPYRPWLWLPFVIFGDLWQLFLLLTNTVIIKLGKPTVRIAFQVLAESIGMIAGQAVLYVIFLPFRAWLSLDAIVRTLFRMLITRHHLLEWQTSEAVEQSLQNTLPAYVRLFAPSLPLAVLLGYIVWTRPDGLFWFLRIGLAALWLLSPWFAWLASQTPHKDRPYSPDPAEERELRVLARLTWRFFEDFSTEENNWLCPDNYQQHPGPRLSDKTSPTNIGMQLVSALSACDLGFITLPALVRHCDRVLRTIQCLPKWNGHLYNWYHVQTLDILWPHYISVVDSGNFLASMITVKNGLLDLAGKPLFPEQLVLGLCATLEAAGLEPATLAGSLANAGERDRLFASLAEANAAPALDPTWRGRIARHADELKAEIERFALADGGNGPAGAERPDGSGKAHTGKTDGSGAQPDDLTASLSLNQLAERGQPAAVALLDEIRSLCMLIDQTVCGADFKPLYDESHRLFRIGYNVSTQSSENSYYDLLASEARTASFLAIAKGDVPQKHWFALGRPLTLVRGIPALVSWSGTMFEYLMPNLLLRAPRGTLVERSNMAAVLRQIRHGRKLGIPWGISESQYYLFDVNANYQYMAFGMQYLRLESTMRPARVVAPYATALAINVKPDAAIANLRRLKAIGAMGTYGLHESLDFNRPNATTLQNFSLVQSFMAHHQGMVLSALNNFINSRILQNRFHREPMVKATEALLEERRSVVPVLLARSGYSINIDQPEIPDETVEPRVITDLNPPTAEAHVLSNGHYLLMLTSGGQGFSSCDDIMVHRWRPQRVGQSHGQFIYVRNLGNGQVWSNTYHPTFVRPDDYVTVFTPDKAEFRRRDGLVSTRTEVALSPLENLEIRRVTFSNRGEEPVLLEATSYLEVVNDRHLAEASHPAFNKLFLEMSYIREYNMLLAGRRGRSASERPGVVLHMVRTASPHLRGIEYETDRRAFLGRGGNQQVPAALRSRLPLAGRPGFSNDPILSLRATVTVPAGESVSLSYFTAWCPNREAALQLGQRLRISLYDEDIFRQALTSSVLERKYLNISAGQHNAIQSLVGPLYYPSRAHRSDEAVFERNALGQSGLWRFGISGDDPIILMRVRNAADMPVVRDVLAAYEFLRQQTVRVDLVLIDEEAEGYALPVYNRIMELTGLLKVYGDEQKKPSLFILRRSYMSEEESTLLSTVARVVVNPQLGIYRNLRVEQAVQPRRGDRVIPLAPGMETLASTPFPALDGSTAATAATAAAAEPTPQAGGRFVRTNWPGKSTRAAQAGRMDKAGQSIQAGPAGSVYQEDQAGPAGQSGPAFQAAQAPLEFFNGIGGFTADGREYEIQPGEGHSTPAPWINVLANSGFGCLVSETGGGYTWAGNSRENRLTPWSNDPTADPAGEAVYVKDYENGAITTPAALQPGRGHDYRVRHGFGYSVFMHNELGLELTLTVFVSADAPVKLNLLTVRNISGRDRRLAAVHYADWALGVLREQAAPYTITRYDEEHSLFVARNVFAPRERQPVSFLFASEPVRSWTGDRAGFLGLGNSIRYPRGLATEQLSGRTGAGLDPCGAIQVDLALADGETHTIVFGLGQTETIGAAAGIADRFRRPEQALEELAVVRSGWDRLLGQVQVHTPDRALDLLLNGWLLYQTLGCRILARSAFYQSGGAIGFRDQLQDTLALLHADPARAANQVRLCSTRQFPEGDVQHWWHPDSGVGVRTLISDDLLWLPYVAAAYVERTGSTALLNEQTPYLAGNPLPPGVHEQMYAPARADFTESIYQHCLRAIERASRVGAHGIPLMGGGDWNDGMNLVGVEGRGESVWLGWFLFSVLKKFAPVCRAMHDPDSADRFETMAEQLRENLEKHAWDGQWYLRAWFDDGSPMGSRINAECQIDSISQAWAALSGAGNPDRVQQALDSARQLLVHPDIPAIQLLSPPFDVSEPNPGYIRGYFPGIRENGGQYTHGAIWLAMAYAAAGRGPEAYALFSQMNPIKVTTTARDVQRYEREPYVVTADITMAEPFVGRGGWSWYTGSASWMYQALLQSLLGIRRVVDRLVLEPAVPAVLPAWQVDYRAGGSLYRIRFENPSSRGTRITSMTLDGKPAEGNSFFLLDDGREHSVVVKMA